MAKKLSQQKSVHCCIVTTKFYKTKIPSLRQSVAMDIRRTNLHIKVKLAK